MSISPDDLRGAIDEVSSHPTALENLRSRVAAAAKDYLSAPLQMDVVEHSEKYVELGPPNNIKGPYDASIREVSRGPMLWVTEPGVRRISIGAPTQVFKTTLITNAILWKMHLDPCPIMVVQPRADDAEKWADLQFTPTLRSSPKISHLVADPKGRSSDNKLRQKKFPGGFLKVANSGSPDELRGLPLALLCLDEIDRFINTPVGHAISIAEDRLSTYPNSLSIRVCTFTVSKRLDEGPTIYSELEASDQRKPFVKCTHCGHDHVMHWRDRSGGYSLVIPTDDNGERNPERAGYACPGCGTIWSEADRQKALKTIRWRQTRKFSCCGVSQDPEARWVGSDQTSADFDRQWHALEGVDRAKCSECGRLAVSNEHAGGWCNRFYDPIVSLSSFAKRFLETIGNREKLRAFVNSNLAEPFDDQVFQEIKPGDVLDRGEPWPVADETDPDLPIPVLTDQVAVITIGVDVQEGHADGKTDRRWAIETVGWGVGEESWSLDYREVPGDVLDTREWDRVLYPLLLRQYRRADGRLFLPHAICIDSGNKPDPVYQFIAKHRGKLAGAKIDLYAVKGASERGGKLRTWAGGTDRASSNKWGVKPQLIGTVEAKETVASHLSRLSPGPGFMHFPTWRGLHWVTGLTAERQVVRKGRRVWEKKDGVANEPLDCRVYALAGLRSLQFIHGLNLEAQARKVGASQSIAVADDVAPLAEAAGQYATIQKETGGSAPFQDRVSSGSASVHSPRLAHPSPVSPAPRPPRKVRPRRTDEWSIWD